MKKILIVSYFFNEEEETGSLRVRGLAKYLPQFNYEPTILTRKTLNSSTSQFNVIETSYDYLLIMKIKQLIGFEINNNIQEQLPLDAFKNRGGLTANIIKMLDEIQSYPDVHKGWIKYAVKEGNNLLKKYKYDGIISSSPPQVAHLVACSLARNNRIPWIADFRDLWSLCNYTEYGRIRQSLDKGLELKTLKNANELVTVSEPLANLLKDLHHDKKVCVITNGYDPDIKKHGWPVRKKFSITYTGRIHKGKRDPEPLFRAIKELKNNNDIQDLEINFYGRYDGWLTEIVRKYELQDSVNIYQIIPRKEAIKRQRESQILLLLNWNDPKETGVYTGKIFEYLAAGRPILSIGMISGVVGELLKQTGAGLHISDIEGIKSFLKKSYDEFKTKGQVEYYGKENIIENYSHIEMARKFSNILNNIT